MSRTEIATEELENDTSSSSGVTLALNGEPLLERPEVERPSCVSYTMHTRISWTLLSKSGTTPIIRSMQTWLTLQILSLTLKWQYTQEIINQIKNMFRTRWAAATQESKQRLKPLLNEPCPPRYSEQQDSLRCYLDPNDLIRDNCKNGVRNSAASCFLHSPDLLPWFSKTSPS